MNFRSTAFPTRHQWVQTPARKSPWTESITWLWRPEASYCLGSRLPSNSQSSSRKKGPSSFQTSMEMTVLLYSTEQENQWTATDSTSSRNCTQWEASGLEKASQIKTWLDTLNKREARLNTKKACGKISRNKAAVRWCSSKIRERSYTLKRTDQEFHCNKASVKL